MAMSERPEENLAKALGMARAAAEGGAQLSLYLRSADSGIAFPSED